jgi:hypothetical protein
MGKLVVVVPNLLRTLLIWRRNCLTEFGTVL